MIAPTVATEWIHEYQGEDFRQREVVARIDPEAETAKRGVRSNPSTA